MLRVSNRRCAVCAIVVAAHLVAAIWAAPVAFGASRKGIGVCPAQGVERARVASVDERLDVGLDDGRILHLAGLEPPRPTPDMAEGDIAARDQLAAKIRGADIRFTPLAQKPDRWGRIPSLVFLDSPGDAKRSVGFDLLRAGLARVKPEIEIRPCLKDWLSAEAGARAAGLGLWADPYYAILAADDDAAFAEKAATDVIVEGRLTKVSSSPIGLRLEFAPKVESKRGRRFSVIILQRNVRIFERADMKFEPLIGRILRVRGLLDMRFGPQMEISSPDEIEVTAGDDNKAQLEVRANKTEAITLVPSEEP
jgi:hypothetical protein